MAAPLSVLYLSDGRAGHRSQALGLQAGLTRAGVPVQWQELPVSALSPWALAAWALTAGRLGHCPVTQPPQVLLGVGHRTHWPLLWLKKIFPRSFALVIMKPSLPLGWFDGVVAPAHDRVKAAANVLQVAGILTPLDDQRCHDPTRGLLLIGGPSRRYRWDSAALWQQIAAVTAAYPHIRHWQLSTSQRTPADFLAACPEGLCSRPDFFRALDGSQGAKSWLAGQLQQAGAVWVTEDSVSMQAEALSAGCIVQRLELPLRGGWGGATRVKGQDKSFTDQATVKMQVVAWLWTQWQQKFKID